MSKLVSDRLTFIKSDALTRGIEMTRERERAVKYAVPPYFVAPLPKTPPFLVGLRPQ